MTIDTHPCATCGHAEAHTNLVGCLADDCDCEGYVFPDAKPYQPKTLETAHQERDAAMEKAERGTDPDWAEKAEQTVRNLAGHLGRDFTPDDVWDDLARRNIPAPREPRALGPILRRLAKDNVIRPKGYTESRRRHGAPVRMYEAGSAL